MPLTATVTPGTTITEDQKVSTSDLNNLGQPTVTISGTVDGSQIENVYPTYSSGDVTGTTSLSIATDAVTATHIATGAVDTDELAADAVTSAKIEAGAVTTTELGADAVDATKIADDAVTTDHLEDNFATGSEKTTLVGDDRLLIADSAASGAVKYAKVSNLHYGIEKTIGCRGYWETSPSTWNDTDDNEGYIAVSSTTANTFKYTNTVGSIDSRISDGTIVMFFGSAYNTTITLPTGGGGNNPVAHTLYKVANYNSGASETTFTLTEMDDTAITFAASAGWESSVFMGIALKTFAKSGDDDMYMTRIAPNGEYMVTFGSDYSSVDDYTPVITAHGNKGATWTVGDNYPDPDTGPLGPSENPGVEAVRTQPIIWEKNVGSFKFRTPVFSGYGSAVDAEFINALILKTP